MNPKTTLMRQRKRETEEEMERDRVKSEKREKGGEAEERARRHGPSSFTAGRADRGKTECRARLSHGRGNSDDIFWLLSDCLIK